MTYQLDDLATRQVGDTHPKPCTKCSGPKVWKMTNKGAWYGYCGPCSSAAAMARHRRKNPEQGARGQARRDAVAQRKEGDPGTPCPKCGAARTWKRTTNQWYQPCSPCAKKQSKVRHRARMGGVLPSERKATRKDGDPAPPCPKCAGPRTWKDYGKDNRGYDHWQAICPPCHSATQRRYYAESEAFRERAKQNVKDWNKANPEKKAINSAKAKAKRRAKLAQAPDDGWSFAALTQMKNTGEYTCFICEKATATEVEHLVPVSLGGGNTWDNLALACKSCNGSKGGSNRHDHLYPGSPGWDEFLRERRES